MKKPLIAFAGLLAFLYMLNPTFGVFEFVPDNIPFIGNLDEATAMMVLLGALRYFGWDLTAFFNKHKMMNFGTAR